MQQRLRLKSLPFFLGVQEAPRQGDFPYTLPFSLTFNETLGLIVQEPNPKVANWIQKAYEFGSSLSTSLDECSFGSEWAGDIIRAIEKVAGTIHGKCFLEVGCGNGFLLGLLKSRGAKRCLGIEPGPLAEVGQARYGVEIRREFFNPERIPEIFDVVFSHGVLEHIQKPLPFLRNMQCCLRHGGILFTAVPNYESGLNIGDLSVLIHEHYNYFTPRSLRRLYLQAGLSSIECVNAEYGWMLYMWGEKEKIGTISNIEVKGLVEKERTLFKQYVIAVRMAIEYTQSRIEECEKQGKSVGIYGAYPNFLLFRWRKSPRFFDGDAAKHGKYLPGLSTPIENPNALLVRPVDEIWVGPIHYDSAIRSFLEKDLGISPQMIISFKDIYERALKRAQLAS